MTKKQFHTFLSIAVISLGFILPFQLHAQNIHVKGLALGDIGKEVQLYTYTDLITYNKELQSIDTVDEKGVFNLSVPVKETQQILVQIENRFGKLYVQPGYQYGVIFPEKDSTRYMADYRLQNIDLLVVGKDSTELNALIGSFNARFDTIFWKKNARKIAVAGLHGELDTFMLQCNKYYSFSNNTYFQNYRNYTFADLNENMGRHRVTIAKRFLLHQPILYNHAEYMQFFNMFFHQHIQHLTSGKNANEILDILNISADYNKLNSLLKNDPYLKNDSMRELVIIKNLFDLYYTPKFKKTVVQSLVEQFKASTVNEQHKLIAENVLRSFANISPGTIAPEFSLTDKNNKEINLKQFKGKYIYLDFCSAANPRSVQELKKTEQLAKKYANQIVFISISIDKDVKVWNTYLKQNPKLNWYLCHYANNKTLLDAYKVNSANTYFFINKDGYIMQAPAVMPSEGIEYKFDEVLKKRRK